MVGANYMGGKRNTARNKSKDVIGRAQRRHFGRQRLASALCVTQEKLEDRVRRASAPSLSSVLPEITLAHARRDARMDSSATSCRMVFSGDRLYSSTSPRNTLRRNKPSKVLGALDISDHISMRAAIDHILQQPSLIGINTLSHKDAAYSEDMRSPAAVRRSTEAYLDSESPDDHSEVASLPIFDRQVSYSPRCESMDLEDNPNTRCSPTEHDIVSLPDSASETCDVPSQDVLDATGYGEAQSLTGANPFFCTECDRPKRPNTFLSAIHPLPQSSPFPSSSQSSDNSILDLDTSPCPAIRIGRTCADTFSLRSMRRPMFRHPSRNFPIRDGSIGMDEAQFTISESTDLDEIELEAARSRTTCCNGDRAFPSTLNYGFLQSLSSDSGCNSIRLSTSQEDRPSNTSIDFLSDPHPWETIDKILKLKPPNQSAVQPVVINFTKDREGVGYVSPDRSGVCNTRPSEAIYLEKRINDEPKANICVALSTDPPTLYSDVSIMDNRMAINTLDSSCANTYGQPLLDTDLIPTTRTEVDPYLSVQTLHGIPSHSMIRCTQDERARASTPLAITVRTTTAEPDADMTFDGPCLFGDSDLEEDE